MFRSPDKVLLVALVVAVSAIPSTRAAAQFTFFPPMPSLDAEVCADDEIILSFNPVYEQLGLDFTDYLFSYLGESVNITRMYPDAHICDPVADPRQLTHIYRVQSVGGPFTLYTAEFYRTYFEMVFMGNYPIAVAVEMDCQVSAQTLPAGFDNGWHQHNIQLDTGLVGGLDPIIAVLDTGIDPSHPAFATTNLETGWNYYGEDADTSDQHGHGTAMAGIIAHLAPDAMILPYKVMYEDGVGYWGAVGRALLDAGSHSADVANLSLGAPLQSPYFFNQVIAEVVDDACYDMVVVSAAGNTCSHGNACPDTFYPAMLPDVLSVMAYDNNGLFFDRSAGYLNDIDMSAPGVGVCVPWSTTANDAAADPWRRITGSSVSSAQAAAVAGLVAADNNYQLSDQDIRTILVDSAVAPHESVPRCGGKPPWLSACAALSHGNCVIDTDLLVGTGNEQACEAWSGPPAQWTWDLTNSTQTVTCPADNNFTVETTGSIPQPALGYCPENVTAALPCVARLTTQPNRRPCPDCDADIYTDLGWMYLTLRLRSFDMADITDLVVRFDDGNSTHSFPLNANMVPGVGTSATLNYWVYMASTNGLDYTAGAPTVSLVTYFQVNNRNTFTIDPLNVTQGTYY